MLVSSDDGRLYRDDLALNGHIIALCDTRSPKVSFKNSVNTTLKSRVRLIFICSQSHRAIYLEKLQTAGAPARYQGMDDKAAVLLAGERLAQVGVLKKVALAGASQAMTSRYRGRSA